MSPLKEIVQNKIKTKETDNEITAYCDICNQGFRGRWGDDLIAVWIWRLLNFDIDTVINTYSYNQAVVTIIANVTSIVLSLASLSNPIVYIY